MVRIYIPESLYKLFAELNKANEIIVKQVESGIDTCQIIYPNNIVPTRKNVLDLNYLNVLSGGVNYFPNDPILNNTKAIDDILFLNDLSGDPAPITKETLIEILQHCGSEDKADFDSARFIANIQALDVRRPMTKYKLIVRRDRDISRGTGTLLSPNDRLLGEKYPNDVVLTIYRVNGSIEKGWNGQPLWIPNIKFPDGVCFYDSDSAI